MRSTDTERTEAGEEEGRDRRRLFVLTSSTAVLVFNTLFHLQPCKEERRTGGEERKRKEHDW